MSTRKRPVEQEKRGNTPIFSARIDPELMDWLRALAAQERRTVAMQLTIALEEYRARQAEQFKRRKAN